MGICGSCCPPNVSLGGWIDLDNNLYADLDWIQQQCPIHGAVGKCDLPSRSSLFGIQDKFTLDKRCDPLWSARKSTGEETGHASMSMVGISMWAVKWWAFGPKRQPLSHRLPSGDRIAIIKDAWAAILGNSSGNQSDIEHSTIMDSNRNSSNHCRHCLISRKPGKPWFFGANGIIVITNLSCAFIWNIVQMRGLQQLNLTWIVNLAALLLFSEKPGLLHKFLQSTKAWRIEVRKRQLFTWLPHSVVKKPDRWWKSFYQAILVWKGAKNLGRTLDVQYRKHRTPS